MAKPMLVTLPCVLLLLDEWPLRRLRRESGAWDLARIARAVAEKLPLVALAAAASAVTLAAQRAGGALQGLEGFPLGLRVANALAAYRAYLVEAIWPHDLAVFYPYHRDIDPNQVVADVALLVVPTIVSLRWLRRWPCAAVGWLWFVGMLVPVIGLVQVGQAAHADRYTYLPLIGLTLPLAFGARDLGLRWPAVAPALRNVGVAALAALAFATAVQVRHWHDSETLFRHALAVTTRNHVAHINLGHALVQQGRLAEAEDHLTQAIAIEPNAANARGLRGEVRLMTHQLDGAREDFEGALRIEPESTRWRIGLARVFVEQEQLGPAERLLVEVVEREPDSAHAQALLGFVRASTGHPAAAVASFRVALEHAQELERVLGRSGVATVHAQLAAALAAIGQPRAAILALDAAIGLDPQRAELHGQRAHLLESAGYEVEAVASYREAVRLGDSSLGVLNNLAWLLATSSRPEVRAPAQAVGLARRAVASSGGADPGVLDTLAVAYAASGQRELALATGRRALALAEAQQRADLAQSIRGRLAEWSGAPSS
jgi:Tfp pilus assembly protein PilF